MNPLTFNRVKLDMKSKIMGTDTQIQLQIVHERIRIATTCLYTLLPLNNKPEVH